MHILLFIIACTLIPIIVFPMRACWAWMCVLFILSMMVWLDLYLVPQGDKERAWAYAVLFFASLNGLAVTALVLRLLVRWITTKPWWTDGKLGLLEILLHTANGVCMGFAIFLPMAAVFEGTGHAYLAHIVPIFVGMVILAFGQSRKLAAIYSWSISLALMASTLASAIYPAVINSSASHQANGERYCIYLNQSWRFAQNAHDLTFLTFGKGTHTAHATLIIEGEDGPIYGNWSYRQSQFMVPWDIRTQPTGHTCPH
ncbi:hypothetical protein BC777_1893 [Yoonia maricola]|uniref:Uncharacterized protein n=1 Tax=Yoonia maricola TaxID=420999 RepID=A0A2M8WQA8_9RHOB|nr:hypothetical protein [Yoonia maricola]PJI93026.1 hypothetical protein BC777_1893 [Yoonia maricola]